MKGTDGELAKARDRYLRHHRALGFNEESLNNHRNSTDEAITLEDLHADDVPGWIEHLVLDSLRTRGVQVSLCCRGIRPIWTT